MGFGRAGWIRVGKGWMGTGDEGGWVVGSWRADNCAMVGTGPAKEHCKQRARCNPNGAASEDVEGVTVLKRRGVDYHHRYYTMP